VSIEKLLYRKVELWAVLLLLILGFVATWLFGWTVQYRASGGQKGGAFGQSILAFAKAPDIFLRLAANPKATLQPQDIAFDEFAGLQRSDMDFQDDGLLLVSSYSADRGMATVFLFDLQREEKIFEWVPPIAEILERCTVRSDINRKENFKSQHPLLLEGAICC